MAGDTTFESTIAHKTAQPIRRSVQGTRMRRGFRAVRSHNSRRTEPCTAYSAGYPQHSVSVRYNIDPGALVPPPSLKTPGFFERSGKLSACREHLCRHREGVGRIPPGRDDLRLVGGGTQQSARDEVEREVDPAAQVHCDGVPDLHTGAGAVFWSGPKTSTAGYTTSWRAHQRVHTTKHQGRISAVPATG